MNAKISHFKQHADLYGRAFVAAESRGLNLADFFAYESSPYPPALATHGIMHSCTKCDLMACLLETSLIADCHAHTDLKEMSCTEQCLDAELQQTSSKERNLESDNIPPESFDVIVNDGVHLSIPFHVEPELKANLLVNMLVLYSNQEYFMIWQEQREWMWNGMINVNRLSREQCATNVMQR